jgi:Phage replication protein CRI
MYDSLDLVLKSEQTGGVGFLETVPQFLTNFTSEGNSNFGKYITGYFENEKVSINDNRVKINIGSLCKFYLGDNFKTLGKGDTRKAIEKLSNSLHLPIDRATVTRIDLAQNFIMQYPDKVYYPYLGEAQYYSRLEADNGLYYNNMLRQLVFYNKGKEQRQKRQPVPELYDSRNVLRFELRYKKKLCKQFNRPEITAGLLYDETFYIDIVKKWKNEYLAIQKINSKLMNMKPTGSKKEFIENLALFQLLEIGQPKVLNIVREWQERGEISKKQAYDLRASVKQLSKTPIDEKGNELINELNRKVKEAARYS